MTVGSWPNLVAMFLQRAGEKGDRPFLWSKKEGAYRPQSWRTVAEEVNALARALRASGIGKGDRVVLVSENRPKWAIADLAIMSAGAITVPAYTTNTPDDHSYILRHSGAKAAIVSTPALFARLLPAAKQAPELDFIIAMEPPGGSGEYGMKVAAWDVAIEHGRESPDDTAAIIEGIGPRDVACLIYTSGTGGRPKGVMLSHAAVACNLMGAHGVLEELGLGDEIFLSFLPLSHSYEHSAGLFFPIMLGAEIYYAESVERLTTNLTEARPTIMTCVPRLYEVMRQRILSGVYRAGGFKQKLFAAAVDLGRRRYENPGSLSLMDRVMDRIVERLVRDKVRDRFGGRLKALVSGGAPLNYDVGVFFVGLGLPVLQGYGQTEAAPVISCNRPSLNKIDTVGPPLDGVEVKIADDGEILVRGDLVMNGYWNDPQATAATVVDGWLHTGDIGVIDDDGCLKITDRKKDIIVNSGGDNLSPQRVEGVLALQPEVAQGLVYGDRKPNVVALIVPDAEFVTSFARTNNVAADPLLLADNKDFRIAFDEAVDRANAELSPIERIRRFAFADEPFAVENGEMTPTMKLRRHVIIERYRDRLEALY